MELGLARGEGGERGLAVGEGLSLVPVAVAVVKVVQQLEHGFEKGLVGEEGGALG